MTERKKNGQGERHRTVAVLLAAGSGARMQMSVTKQRLMLAGQSVLARAAAPFAASDDIDALVVVTRADEVAFVREELSFVKKPLTVTVGANTRAGSARIGVLAAGECELVAIHDVARCLLTGQMLAQVLAVARQTGAATASVAVTDTVKQVDGSGCILRDLPRHTLRAMQTPQIFRRADYLRALSAWDSMPAGESVELTDDNRLMEQLGIRVTCVDTGPENRKVTTPDDIGIAEWILRKRGESV